MATIVISGNEQGAYSLWGGSAPPDAGVAYAQSFIMPEDGSITTVRITMYRTTVAPGDNVEVKITTTLGGTPLGTSAPVDADTLGDGWANRAFAVFDFLTPIDVTASTTYYAEIYRTGARNTVNYAQVVNSETSDSGTDAWALFADGNWYKTWADNEDYESEIDYNLALTLVNPQTTRGYDTTRTTRKPRTAVTATEYDDTQTTRKPRTSVTSTVEGSQ